MHFERSRYQHRQLIDHWHKHQYIQIILVLIGIVCDMHIITVKIVVRFLFLHGLIGFLFLWDLLVSISTE